MFDVLFDGSHSQPLGYKSVEGSKTAVQLCFIEINIETNLGHLKIVENGIIEVVGCNREDEEHKRIKPSVSIKMRNECQRILQPMRISFRTNLKRHTCTCNKNFIMYR